MKKDTIKSFFRQFDKKTQDLVDEVLSVEQEYISYQMNVSPKQAQEIKQAIKKYIDRMQNKDEA